MVKNTVQFQGGLSLPRSPVTCGTEAQRRLALFTMLRPQGSAARNAVTSTALPCRVASCTDVGTAASRSRRPRAPFLPRSSCSCPSGCWPSYLVTQSTPRAASSFSLCAVPWSTGAQRLSAGFYFFRHTPFNWIYWPTGVFSRAFCPASCSTACSCVLFLLAISS